MVVAAACGGEDAATPIEPSRHSAPDSTVIITAASAITAAHLDAGITLQELGRLSEAIAEYDEAIRLDPKLAEGYNNRGSAYHVLGQLQRAVVDFDEAIRLDPKYAGAYNNREVHTPS